jgi:NTE family protein
VGLVLSGGGARGVAHVGVLKVLQELRIPVDFIAGTSMGSLVGGIYAAGMSPAEMEKRIGAIDWAAVFRDNPERKDIPWRQKRDDFTSLFGLELGLRDGKLLVPLGTVAGYKFEFLMTDFVGLEAGRTPKDFDHLPIPYRAVAMDLKNGDMRVFDRGYLVKAMRASMSIPAAFAPVQIDGNFYVDGGMVRNLPVDVARKAGCEIVIAVNLGTPPLRLDQITSSVSVALQAINLMTEQNVKSSLGELTAKDILILPKLGEFSSSDFTNAMATVPIGVAAAREVEDRLRALSVSETEYRAWQQSRAARKPGEVKIDDIQVAHNLKRVNPDVITAEIKQKPTKLESRLSEMGGEQTDLQNLHRNLETVFGRGDFERVDYRLKEDPGDKKIIVDGIEKSWGPNYLKFGLGYAGDFSTQQRFNVSMLHRMTWLNSLGAEWRNDVRLGYDNEFHTEFYQPFTHRMGIFIAPWLDVRQERIAYYYGSDVLGTSKVTTYRGGLDLGVQGRLGEMRVGFFQGRLNTDPQFGALSAINGISVSDYNLRQGGWMGRFAIDQLNSTSFPREGLLLAGKFFITNEAFGADDKYNKYEMIFQKPFNIDRHTLTLGLFYADSPDSKLPSYDLFQMGGFQRFSGYFIDQITGDSYSLGRLVYNYRFTELPSALGGGVYLGGSLEAGRVGNRFDPTTAAGTLYCGSIFFGADTIMGPLYLAYGRAGDGSGTFYVMLGMRP